MIHTKNTFRHIFQSTLSAALDDPAFADFKRMITDDRVELMFEYSYGLVQANERVNLTGIVDPEEVAVKHVFDSLLAFTTGLWPTEARVCDVGTGGGIPGAILNIARPDLNVTLMDSVRKKLREVDHLCSEIGISVQCVHGRAEDFGKDVSFREQFDVVVARAVARLPALLELCLPLVNVGGCFIALKGPDVEEEVHDSRDALRHLGGVVRNLTRVTLPFDAGERTLIDVHKTKVTPHRYPRSPGIPVKSPL